MACSVTLLSSLFFKKTTLNPKSTTRAIQTTRESTQKQHSWQKQHKHGSSLGTKTPPTIPSDLTWHVFPFNSTSCSTSRGIGLQIVRQLIPIASNLVIASCRDPASAEELKNLQATASNLHVVQLDVTDEQSIKAAADSASEILKKKGLGLDFLINNAGVVSVFFPNDNGTWVFFRRLTLLDTDLYTNRTPEMMALSTWRYKIF